jgi:hypothetical protein
VAFILFTCCAKYNFFVVEYNKYSHTVVWEHYSELFCVIEVIMSVHLGLFGSTLRPFFKTLLA